MRSVALLAALTALLFSRSLALGQVFLPADILLTWYPWKAGQPDVVPRNRLLSDVVATFYPQDAFFAAELRRGVFPLWDPTILGGHPSFANGWSAQLYPPRLVLLALLPVDVAHTANLALHVFVAGLAALLLLRRLGAGGFGALVGAVAWMLNGYVMAWLEFGHTVATAALLPLALLGGHAAARRRSPRWALLTGGVVALGLLSGSLQRGAYLLLALAAYLGYRAAADYLAERQPAALLWPLACGALAVGAGLALAAVVLLPTLELAGVSQRGALTLAQLFPQPWLRLGLLAAFVAPGIAGGPTWPVDLYPAALTNANEFQGYAGLLPLLLAGVAAARPRGPALFFGLLALVSLLLALGSPLYLLAYYLLPGFDRLGPQRVLILYGFGVAMLAGIGADRLAGARGPELARRLQAGLLLALGLAGLGVAGVNLAARLGRERILELGREHVRSQVYGTPLNPASLESYYRQVEEVYERLLAHLSPSSAAVYLPAALAAGCLLVLWLRQRESCLFPLACLALVALDLGSFAWSYNPTADRSLVYPRTPGVDFLLADRSLYRVALDTGAGTLFPDTLQPFGIHEVGGYESLYPDRYADLLASVEAGQPTLVGFGNIVLLSRFDSPLLDLLNTKYVVRPPGSPAPGERYTLVYDGDLAIYENRAALPRAFVATDCRLAPDGAAALAALAGPAFPLGRVVVLERDAGEPAECGRERAVGQATVVSYAANQVAVRATASEGGWLVLADTWAPGWTATLDGAPALVLRADYTLRAVALPPGEHAVTFSYAPASLRSGAAVSLAALVAVVAGLAVGARRERRAPAVVVGGSAGADRRQPLPERGGPDDR